jgi:hypothetical protein
VTYFQASVPSILPMQFVFGCGTELILLPCVLYSCGCLT